MHPRKRKKKKNKQGNKTRKKNIFWVPTLRKGGHGRRHSSLAEESSGDCGCSARARLLRNRVRIEGRCAPSPPLIHNQNRSHSVGNVGRPSIGVWRPPQFQHSCSNTSVIGGILSGLPCVWISSRSGCPSRFLPRYRRVCLSGPLPIIRHEADLLPYMAHPYLTPDESGLSFRFPSGRKFLTIAPRIMP